MSEEEFYLIDLKSRFDKIKPNTYYLSYSGGTDSHFLYWFIKEYLKSLKLELNTKKTRIDSIKNGIDFLGFNFYLKNNKLILKVRNGTKKNFKKKIKRLNKLYFENKITDKDRKCVIDSYIGHLSYGDCNNLLKSNLNNTIEG